MLVYLKLSRHIEVVLNTTTKYIRGIYAWEHINLTILYSDHVRTQ